MTKTNQLPSGNYMNAYHVIETLNHRFCRPTLASIAEKVCTKHQGEYGTYFSTTDLKNIMMPDLFKELECEVTTHMILSEEEKQSYYNNKLTYDQITKRK